MANDANLRLLITRGNDILWLGRNERYASRAQYLALVARDGECRWPGCHTPAAWCDAIHLTNGSQVRCPPTRPRTQTAA
jgi:hypothetical protein